MKQYYKIVLGLMAIFFSITLSAQQENMMLYERDVNGVRIGTMLTREQIVAESHQCIQFILIRNVKKN